MKVLIVEFVKEIREHLVSLLKSEGFTVDSTDNGRIGLEYVRKNHYQLIITNAALYELRGLSMIMTMREENIDCPIFVFTARNRWQDIIMAYMVGADYYASMPLHDHEYLACIQEVMAGQDSAEMLAAREEMLSTEKTNWFASEMKELTSDEKEWLPEEVENRWLDQEKQRAARREKKLLA